MLKVVNISKRYVNLGEVILSPLQSYIFKNGISDDLKARINSLVAIGVLKIYNVNVIEEKVTKKSNKKK